MALYLREGTGARNPDEGEGGVVDLQAGEGDPWWDRNLIPYFLKVVILVFRIDRRKQVIQRCAQTDEKVADHIGRNQGRNPVPPVLAFEAEELR